MHYDCATYSSEADALAGARMNWINYVKERVPEGEKAKTPSGQIIDSLEGLSDDQIAELKLVGSREGHLVTDNGTTVSYATPIKAYDLELWYYTLPPDKYMVGVENCTVKSYDPAWIPPYE